MPSFAIHSCNFKGNWQIFHLLYKNILVNTNWTTKKSVFSSDFQNKWHTFLMVCQILSWTQCPGLVNGGINGCHVFWNYIVINFSLTFWRFDTIQYSTRQGTKLRHTGKKCQSKPGDHWRHAVTYYAYFLL